MGLNCGFFYGLSVEMPCVCLILGIQRQQPVSRKQMFWAEVASLQAEMKAEGT